MKIKDGATVDKWDLGMREAATAVEECYAAFGAECVLTSGDERETIHRGRPIAGHAEDPHYEGLAGDFRIWSVPEASRAALVTKITETLGDAFVVLWERGATPHLHVQRGHVG